MRIDAKVGEQAEGWTCVGVGVVDDFYDFTDSAAWVGDISLGFMELDIAAEELGGHVRCLGLDFLDAHHVRALTLQPRQKPFARSRAYAVEIQRYNFHCFNIPAHHCFMPAA